MMNLSDDQLEQVLDLAAPIPVEKRDEFLRILADELRGRSDVGGGELYRLCIDARRRVAPWTSMMVEQLG